MLAMSDLSSKIEETRSELRTQLAEKQQLKNQLEDLAKEKQFLARLALHI